MEGDNITRKKMRKVRGSPISPKEIFHNKVFLTKNGSF
jgi:hypothetical protein